MTAVNRKSDLHNINLTLFILLTFISSILQKHEDQVEIQNNFTESLHLF